MTPHTCFKHIKTAVMTCAALAAVLSTVLSAETLVVDFESGATGFRSGTNTIAISTSGKVTASKDSRKSMHVKGSVADGGIYAVSEPYPMDEFRQYRLTAWIRIDTLVSKTQSNPFSNAPVPRVGCEFMTSDPNSSLGTAYSAGNAVTTIRIRNVEAGDWMLLTGEFRAPWGTRQCRLVIDGRFWPPKGNFEYEADFYVDDIIIESIEHYTVEGKYSFHIPLSLEKMRGVHPRLYLTKERIAELREKIETTHAPLWNEVREQADDLLKRNPPEYRGNDEGRYDEQWWQSVNGRSMITLAAAYLMTDDRRYLDGARTWALATCNYKTWGVDWADGIDCMTGHHLYGLAVVYDWCRDSLDREALGIIRETLVKRARVMFAAAAKGSIVPDIDEYRVRPWPEWDEAYLQNHLWVNSCGLSAAGLALFDEVEDAGRWIAFSHDRFSKTMGELGRDGASHEGINYWSYGVEHLLKFMYLARDLLDEDMYGNEWFRNTATYRMYMSIPFNAWAGNYTTVDYGDSYRRDHSGPDHILRALAGEYRDGYAQWLAAKLDDSGVLGSGNRWLNLIWYDPTVEQKRPDNLPTLRHFPDMDFVSARSDWSGNESFVFFKCGPYIGHKAVEDMVYCPSSAHHTHPDQNHFTVFGEGEWLIRDDGNNGKYTGQHNTLIIDGGEQLGGGDSIFDAVELHAKKLKPRILRAKSTPEFDHITGDATEVYPKSTGLRRFVRHLLYVKPDVLIVADDIELGEAHDLELRFHPEQQEAERLGNAFFMRGEHSVLCLDALTPGDTEIIAEKHDLVDRRYNKEQMLAVKLRTRQRAWRNAVALTWSAKDVEPKKVAFYGEGDTWTFGVGGRKIVLDWSTGKATFE